MDPPLLLQLFIFGFSGFYIKDRSQINHSLGSEMKGRACLRSGKTDFLIRSIYSGIVPAGRIACATICLLGPGVTKL